MVISSYHRKKGGKEEEDREKMKISEYLSTSRRNEKGLVEKKKEVVEKINQSSK